MKIGTRLSRYLTAMRADVLGHAAFAAAVALILVMAWTLFGVMSMAKKSEAWTGQSLELVQLLGDLDGSLAHAEQAHGVFLSGDGQRFRAELDRAIASVNAQADKLRRAVALDQRQRERTVKLQALIADRFASMQEEHAARANEGAERTAAFAAAMKGLESGVAIRNLSGEMEREEMRLLAERRAAQQQSLERSLWVLGIAIAIALAVLVPGYLGFVKLGRARHRAERRVFDMAQSMPAAVFQYRSFSGGPGRYEFFSDSAQRLRGVPRARALEDPEAVLGTVLPKDRAALLGAMEKAELGRTLLEHDFRVQDQEGKVRWLRVVSMPRQEADGVLWTGHWEDVTEKRSMARSLKELNESLDESVRARRRFVATLSHELRTPLSSALATLELLTRTSLDDEQKASLYVVYESAQSAMRIVDDILDFSRVEAGMAPLHPEPASIRHVVGKVAEAHTTLASGKGSTLTHAVDDRISPAVLVDTQRLQQILNNFLSHAIASSEKGAIELKAELLACSNGEDVVRFTVRDTRPRSAEAGGSRLFEPFVGASEETTHRYDGTGLGLSMCRRLAELMGGSVDTQGEEGAGNRMVLVVPLPVATEASAPEGLSAAASSAVSTERREAPSAQEAEAEGTLVLVVDDHPINRLVLLRQVNTLGYAAEAAQDGVEATERWSSGRFGLVITDCQMPEMDGYELARHIREVEARSSNVRVPIIACTATPLGDEEEKCLAAGMDDYVAKPIQLSVLAAKLQRWLPLPGSPLVLATDQGVVPAAPPRPALDPIDRAILVKVSGGDSRKRSEVLSRFRSVAGAETNALRGAIEGVDIKAVMQASRRIKEESDAIGAFPLSKVAGRIESAATANDWSAIGRGMEEFRREQARLNSSIEVL